MQVSSRIWPKPRESLRFFTGRDLADEIMRRATREAESKPVDLKIEESRRK